MPDIKGMVALSGESRIAGALFGKTQRRVLGLLFPNSQRDFSLSEIVRAVGTGMGAVQRELTRLVEAGLVTRRRRGNRVLYQANRHSPVFGELRGLMVKTAGAADVLRDALSGIAERIQVAFIYGSIARGSEDTYSDVDVMVVGDVSFAEVVNALHHTQTTLAREVNPGVYPAAEFREKAVAGQSFVTTVLEEPKVFLIGGEDELGRLAAQRLADAA